jgi:hypothetical protein
VVVVSFMVRGFSKKEPYFGRYLCSFLCHVPQWYVVRFWKISVIMTIEHPNSNISC